MSRKIKVFISYSHEDELMKRELDKSLIGLKRSNKVEVWHDRMLLPSTVWDYTIKQELEAADIILLLISVDFNNSQYIWDQELAVAMQRHEIGETRVIPVILRECDWAAMPYAKLQALPAGGRPVNDFGDMDKAYTDVAKGVSLVVDFLINLQNSNSDN